MIARLRRRITAVLAMAFVVILAGGNPRQPSMPEATVMRRIATELGIRPEVRIVEIADDVGALTLCW